MKISTQMHTHKHMNVVYDKVTSIHLAKDNVKNGSTSISYLGER